jgi:hypothetical protein
MARIAMDESAHPSLRAQMYKELAQYVASKNTIEAGDEEAGPVPVNISWAES